MEYLRKNEKARVYPTQGKPEEIVGPVHHRQTSPGGTPENPRRLSQP
jgi:hypothetical protein